MVEHFIKAVVLDKEDAGEFDSRVFLYSQELGKIAAKITSARKITSKLAGHLEPGNLVAVRLVQKNSFQVADALKIGGFAKDPETLSALRLIKEIAPENLADEELWNLFEKNSLSPVKTLAILGFDNQFAECRTCGANAPKHFLIANLEYICGECFLKSGRPAAFTLK